MGEIKSFLEVKMQIMLHNIHFLDEKECKPESYSRCFF